MRAHHFILTVLLALSGAAATAQAPVAMPSATPPATPAGTLQREDTAPSRTNQKIERIVTEDSGSRVEEIRVGGQTQSINVQPRNGIAYEVKPADGIRAAPVPPNARDSSTGGSRVWNIGNF